VTAEAAAESDAVAAAAYRFIEFSTPLLYPQGSADNKEATAVEASTVAAMELAQSPAQDHLLQVW
jgi:hypothetical protein